MKQHFYLLVILWLSTTFLAAQNLKKTEQRILDRVGQNHDEAIKFLEKVVNMNSGTLNQEGVKEVGKVFGAAFDGIGFETKWIDMPEGMHRGGHLFAENQGSKGKRLLLIGHLDTVFEEDSPFQKWEVTDSIATGPGTVDMKGGDVVMLYALKALHELGLLKKAQIVVALHGDEERTGKPLEVSRRDIIEAAKRSDIALGFEPSTGYSMATVARRGSSGWRLEVEGKRAHSSSIFSERTGAGAIFEASRILNEFYKQLSQEEFLTFNPGLILGGTFVNYDQQESKGDAFGKNNVVAQKVTVTGGLRFITEEQKESARERMRAIVAQNLPQTSATISFADSYPSMRPTEGNDAVLKVLDKVSRDMGQGEVLAYDPGRRGAADISFVAEYVDGLDGLGTMGGGSHTPQEFLNLATFEDLTKRTALLIYRLINTK